jgi:hypothetical protein
MKELSGARWVSRYPTSSSVGALAPEFQARVNRFVGALTAGHAAVHVTATYRPVERAWLMHYSFLVARGGLDPRTVPARPDVEIEWVHKNRAGAVDLAASRGAAQEMVSGYEIVYQPALASMHTRRLAVDMNISWSGTLHVADATGHAHVIGTAPHTGAGNQELWAVGATYGVHKLASDAPHWSSNGH